MRRLDLSIGILGSCLGAYALMACSGQFGWGPLLHFRASSEKPVLGPVDPAEPVAACVRGNVDYASVKIERAFFRNMPGVYGDADVIVGMSLQGILGQSRPINIVSDVVRTGSGNGEIHLQNALEVRPYLYKGQGLDIEMSFRVTPRPDAVRGALSVLRDELRLINPSSDSLMQHGLKLFSSFIENADERVRTWRYRFALIDCHSVQRDKPEQLFTAARHILLAMPTGSPPKALRRLRGERFLNALRLKGDTLVWADTEEEYRLTPYLIVNVTRYDRGGRFDDPVYQARERVMAELDDWRRSPKILRRALERLREALAGSDLSGPERQLEQSWLDYFEVLAQASQEHAEKDLKDESAVLGQAILRVLDIREQHKLHPKEEAEIGYILRRHRRQLEDLSSRLKAPVDPRVQRRLLADDEARARKTQDAWAAAAQRARALTEARRLAGSGLAKAWPDGDRDFTQDARPFWHKWWFWSVVGAVAAGGAVSAYVATRPSPCVGICGAQP